MSTQLETSIVRIRTHDGIVVGAGFLVTEKLLLTCAHVVAQALDIPQDTSEIPTDEISLDFPLVAAGENVTAKVIKWLPVQPDGSGDLACLELLSKPPKEARPALLITEDKLWGHAFRAFGFPAAYDNGVWASGVLRAKQADGWVQIEDTKQTGYFIEPGFSGTAIWDEEVNGVVGMTVVAEKRAEVRAAFVIPISCILELLPELAQQTIPPCPYRGLFAFREKDAEFFFGREMYTEKLVEVVQKNSLVAVIGASGSGKSSVVYARLIPQLRKTPGISQAPGISQKWLIASFRPLSSPFYELSTVLIPFLEPDLDEIDRTEKIEKLTHKFTSGNLSLTSILKSIARKNPDSCLLLFIDQFEELYTLCRQEDERRQFLDTLLGASGVQTSVCVLTMRADFLSKALSYRPFADTLQDASMMLGPMNREELRATIERPAKMLDVDIEEGLTDRILDVVSDEPGNLPLLEFALTKLWEKQSNRRLTHTAYDEIGGVEQTLTSYANSEYKKLGPKEQEQAKRIFLQLIRPGEGTEDTRRIASRSDVGEDNWELVTRLASARLVVTGGSQMDATSESGAHLEETVEVIHESLIAGWPLLREWIDVDRDFLTWQERLRVVMHQWITSKKDEGALLRGAPLAEAERWLEQRQNDLSQEEQHFIEASLEFRNKEIAEREAQRQRELETAKRLQEEATKRERAQRKFAQRLKVLLAIILSVALIALFQWREANRQRQIADQKTLEAQNKTQEALEQKRVADEQKQQADESRQKAEINSIEALTQTSKVLFLSHDELGALLAGLKAGIYLKTVTVPTALNLFSTKNY